MSNSFRCSRGHEWSDPFADADAADPEPTVVCPVCGEAVRLPQALPPTSLTPAATLAPSAADTDENRPTQTLSLSSLPRGDAAPALVPGYEIMGELGRGGMGVVYKARQVKLNRLVALKMVLAGGHAGLQGLERFRLEAEAVAQLQHPNIVQIYEVGTHNGLPYFSMEYVDGGSLANLANRRPLPPGAAAAIVETIARAIHAAHLRGIIHRDLKPSNILLQKSDAGNRKTEGTSADDRSRFQRLDTGFIPKITDFGLAKRLDVPQGQTASGEIMGTPSYMSPEQAQGRIRELGPATDVYALGAILYDLLTGRPPFESDQAVDTLLQVVMEEPIPPRRLQGKVPRDLDTICLKCLEKSPGRRYPSAEALADDLRRFWNNEPIQARPVGDWERLVKWSRRRPALAALCAVSALAVLVLLGVSWWFVGQLSAKNAELAALAERERRQAAEAIRQRQLAEENAAEAQRQRLAAQQNLDRAQENERLARRNFDEAQRQRQLAEASERKARAAVDQMLMVVGRDLLEDVPGLEQARRRQLLEKALDFYQGFLRAKQSDPETRQETALAHYALGRVHEGLGQLDQAETAYRQAIVLQEALHQDFPSNPRYQQDLANSLNYLGEALRKRGRADDAEKAYRRAHDLQQELNRQGKVSAYQQELARSLYNLGILHRERGDRQAAADFQSAIGLLQPLVEQFPREPEYRRELARCYLNLGNVLKDLDKISEARSAYSQAVDLYGRLAADFRSKAGYREELADAYKNRAILLSLATAEWPSARRDYQQAISLLTRLADDFPDRPKYRHELANCHSGLGGIAFFEKKPAEAEQHYQQALALEEKLADQLDGVPDYQSGLGSILDNYALLLREQKRLAEAVQRLEQALPRHQAAFRASPRHPLYRKFLLNHYVVWANTLLRQGNYAELARHAAMLPRVLPDDWLESYAAAELGCRALAGLARDSKLAEAERKKLAGQYADQAIRALRQAVDKGYADAAALLANPVFEPIRPGREFQELVSQLKSKS